MMKKRKMKLSWIVLAAACVVGTPPMASATMVLLGLTA